MVDFLAVAAAEVAVAAARLRLLKLWSMRRGR